MEELQIWTLFNSARIADGLVGIGSILSIWLALRVANMTRSNPETNLAAKIISSLFGYGSFNEKAVFNSARALYYFSLGLPAFAMIKVFSNFFFANHDTKTPFYISLISVLLNVFISIYYFRSVGFIIIPIATTISSLSPTGKVSESISV